MMVRVTWELLEDLLGRVTYPESHAEGDRFVDIPREQFLFLTTTAGLDLGDYE